MIQARAALYGHLRTFIERELSDLVAYDALRHGPADPEFLPDGRPAGRNRFRERIRVMFGEYDLLMESTTEAPPLGRITLYWPGGSIEGPLDSATWRKIADHIKAQGGL